MYSVWLPKFHLKDAVTAHGTAKTNSCKLTMPSQACNLGAWLRESRHSVTYVFFRYMLRHDEPSWTAAPTMKRGFVAHLHQRFACLFVVIGNKKACNRGLILGTG